LVIMCLEYIGNAAVIPALIDVPGGDGNDLSGAAARALASLGILAADAIPELIRASEDDGLWVRTAEVCPGGCIEWRVRGAGESDDITTSGRFA